MRTVGMITTVVIAAVVVGGILVGVRSLPDIQRYLRMRKM